MGIILLSEIQHIAAAVTAHEEHHHGRTTHFNDEKYLWAFAKWTLAARVELLGPGAARAQPPIRSYSQTSQCQKFSHKQRSSQI